MTTLGIVLLLLAGVMLGVFATALVLLGWLMRVARAAADAGLIDLNPKGDSSA